MPCRGHARRLSAPAAPPPVPPRSRSRSAAHPDPQMRHPPEELQGRSRCCGGTKLQLAGRRRRRSGGGSGGSLHDTLAQLPRSCSGPTAPRASFQPAGGASEALCGSAPSEGAETAQSWRQHAPTHVTQITEPVWRTRLAPRPLASHLLQSVSASPSLSSHSRHKVTEVAGARDRHTRPSRAPFNCSGGSAPAEHAHRGSAAGFRAQATSSSLSHRIMGSHRIIGALSVVLIKRPCLQARCMSRQLRH